MNGSASPIPSRAGDLVEGALAERLAGLPGFAQLPHGSLALVVSAATSRLLRQGEEILKEGRPSEVLFVVLSGRLKMTRTLDNGRKVLLGLFSPGDPVGVSLLGGRPSDATVAALESSLCLCVSTAKLLAAMGSSPALLRDLLPILTRRMAECGNCAIEGTFSRVEPRFAKLFLKLGESVGRPGPGGLLIPVPLSRQDLADMAGTTIETTIRVLSRWGKEGVVETRDDGFLLHDRGTLETICGD